MIKSLIRRFVDWMEHGPAILTIPFIPILLVIAAIAVIINKLKGSPLMKKFQTFKERFSLFVKRMKSRNGKHKRNPDWSRVDEPDNILPSLMYYVVGIPIAALSMMFAYSIINGSLADWIAVFIATNDHRNVPLEEKLAVFTAAVILLTQLVVIFAFSLNRVPDGDDIVEMISDLDENVNDRIAELERSVNSSLDTLTGQVTEITIMSNIPDEDLKPQEQAAPM